MMNSLTRNFSLVIVIFLLSFHVYSSENTIIAENHDKSIKLTESQLSKWLTHNKNSQYYDKKTQIEDFFIQQEILSKKPELPPNTNQKIDFYHSLNIYNQARIYFKKQLSENLDINSNVLYKEFENLNNKQKTQTNKVRLYQIYKRYPSKPSEKDKQNVLDKMKHIRSQIGSLDDFKKLATIESNAQSRLKKGLIGNVYKGQFDPKIDAIVMKMKKNDLSKILTLPTGLVIFYCEKVIPTKIKSDKELNNIAFKKLKSDELLKTWTKKQQEFEDKNKIIFDWSSIHDSNNKLDIVIKLTTSHLSKQKLSWLLNKYNSNLPLADFSNERIKSFVYDYFLNKQLFNQLDKSTQNTITQEQTHKYNEIIYSEVVIMLVKPKIKEPAQQQIIEYYKEREEDFYTPKKFNLSVLAFKLNKNNRKEQYKNMQLIHDELINNKINFHNAIKKHSTIQKKFPNMELNDIAIKRMNKIFGIRISKYITQMEHNKLSDIIETKSGYLWIVKLNGTMEPELISINEAKEHINNILMNTQLELLQLELFDEVLKKQNIKMNL